MPRRRRAARAHRRPPRRAFTFGELQLQLGQPGPHLQRQGHALQAAVRHARAARTGSPLLWLPALPLCPRLAGRGKAAGPRRVAESSPRSQPGMQGEAGERAGGPRGGTRRGGRECGGFSSPPLSSSSSFAASFRGAPPWLLPPPARDRSASAPRRARPTPCPPPPGTAAAAPPGLALAPLSPPGSGWRRRWRCGAAAATGAGRALPLSHPRDRAATAPPAGGAPRCSGRPARPGAAAPPVCGDGE